MDFSPIQQIVVRILLTVFAAGFVTAAAQEQPAAAPVNAEADYTGKVLVISMKGNRAGGLLETVKVRALGGRVFLVGRLTDDGTVKNEFKGVTVWLAVDEVSQIFEFKNVAEAQKAVQSWSKAP